jgi:hypothetical protein
MKQQKIAHAVEERDWCGEVGPSSDMQGGAPSMMSPPSSENVLTNSQRSFDFEDFKDRIRSGLSQCMSHSSQHLKDEVGLLATIVNN